MSRYRHCFETLTAKRQGAFIPFVTLGDPNPELSLRIIDTLIAAGADALELGIPFSDPVADGPTIQNATVRALQAGTTPTCCFSMIHSIRAKYPALPIGLLLYANLVHHGGINNFYQRAKAAGVDSVLIADVPIEMCAPFKEAADAVGIDTIFIAPPNADEVTLQKVAELGQGYTYLLSRAGVTGSEIKAKMPVQHRLDTLHRFNAPPCILGFGIATPAQVEEAITAGADGVISGSAVVQIIEQYQDEPKRMLSALQYFVSTMKAATNTRKSSTEAPHR